MGRKLERKYANGKFACLHCGKAVTMLVTVRRARGTVE